MDQRKRRQAGRQADRQTNRQTNRVTFLFLSGLSAGMLLYFAWQHHGALGSFCPVGKMPISTAFRCPHQHPEGPFLTQHRWVTENNNKVTMEQIHQGPVLALDLDVR